MRLRYLMRTRSRGRDWWYVRIGGKLIGAALPDLPHDHPDFLAAYAARLKEDGAEPSRPPPGTIAAMVDDFLRSPTVRAKSRSYQAVLGRHAAAIRAKAGTAQGRHLEARHIAADLAALTPGAAQSRMKTWRLMCSWAVSVGHLSADPTATVKRPRLPKSAGHEPWTAEEVAAYRARWPIGSVRRAIFELIHWTGARISDAVILGPGMVGRDGVLAYRQTKTGDLAYVPWTNALPGHAAGMDADRSMMHEALLPFRGHMTFLATKEGRTRSGKAIGGDLAAAARVADVRKTAHGLRATRATALADAGASAHAIASWTGHQSLSEVQHYTRAAERRRAAMGVEVQSTPDRTAKQ